jgi:ATP-dependent DNA helicase RecG
MSTTLAELEKLMALPSETEQLEFKAATNQFDTTKLCRYCVAMANEGGGRLILGVSDKLPRKVVATQAFSNLEDIKVKLRDRLRMAVMAEVVNHPDGRVVVFEIPSRPPATPLEFEGSYLMRSGEGLVAMTPDRLRKIFAEGAPDFLSQIAARGLSGDDVIRLLDTQSYFDLLQIPYPSNRDGVLEKFSKENLIFKHEGNYNVSNLGALLFAKNLRDFDTVSDKAPRVLVYQGKDRLSSRSDITGSKGYAFGFENLIEYIHSQTSLNEHIGHALRENVMMFPPLAVRELTANALIHQDFTEIGTSVRIEIYSDRIEFTNLGIPSIPTERFIDEDKARNERLADICRRLRLCEKRGGGIDRVINVVELFQLPAPDFRVTEKHTKAILFAHVEFDEMSKSDKIRACYQHCVLKHVMNEKMSNQSLRERFKLSDNKSDLVSRIIRDAIDTEKIKLDDPENFSKRYARYIPFWA